MSFPKQFAKLNRIIGVAANLSVSGKTNLTSVIHAHAIQTVLSMSFQTPADDTLQLLDSELSPISSPWLLEAGAIWTAPGRLMANNERIYLQTANGSAVIFELVWRAGNCVDDCCDYHNRFYNPDDNADANLGSVMANVPAQTSVGTVSGLILAANTKRKECIVINSDTTIIYLGLGQTPSATAYHVALSACSTANDGTGGVFVSDLWKGAINAIGSASGGHVCVTEET
jgi:hypothetical protein